MPFEAVGALASPLISKIFPGKDDTPSGSTSAAPKNFFPSNFKLNYKAFVTRRFKDVSEIPTVGETDNTWLLDGIYWLDTFNLTEPAVYTGTGTIIVSKFNPSVPIMIKGGGIICKKAADNVTPTGHLNLMIIPVSATATNESERMLYIAGRGNVIEGSVFSFYGIKTDPISNIDDFASIGIDGNVTMDKWGSFFSKLFPKTNVIIGNYVNYFMNKDKLRGDLWVVHNVNGPVFFDRTAGSDWKIVQNRLDTNDPLGTPQNQNEIIQYQIMVHEFYMSPKIQHVAIRGGTE